MRQVSLAVAAMLLIAPAWSMDADGPAPANPLPPTPATNAAALLKARDTLRDEAKLLVQAGKVAEAMDVAWKKIAVEEQIFGRDHEEVIKSLEDLAQMAQRRSLFGPAEQAQLRVLASRERTLDKEHFKVVDARLALANIRVLKSLTDDQRRTLKEANDQLQRAVRLSPQDIEYAKAMEAAAKVPEALAAILGAEHSAVAASLEKLASRHQRVADYAKAEPLYLRALQSREKTLGLDHPGTATSLNNLAGLYHDKADYAKAEPLYLRSLTIWERTLGPDHSSTAASLNNLAELYRAMGDGARAEPLAVRALKIWEKNLGPEHAHTATCLNNLALLYKEMGDHAKAEPLQVRAVRIWEKIDGPEHRQTASGLNNLALLYIALGDYTRAEPLSSRALEIWEKALGPEHPGTALGLNTLGLLHHHMGDHVKAESHYTRALRIREKVLGAEHPETVVSLSNLAGLHESLGDYAKAEPLRQSALSISRKKLGDVHPGTAASLSGLAGLYSRRGEPVRAEPLYLQALKIQEKAAGSEHPATAATLHNLAVVYRSLGDFAKAEPLAIRALNISEKALGPRHPETASRLSNLALLYYAMGESAKAEPLARRDVQMTRHQLDLASGDQSERQQYQMVQHYSFSFAAWLSMSRGAGVAPAEVFAEVLDWKGKVTARQHAQRLLRQAVQASGDQQVMEEFAQLEQVVRQLATRTLGGPRPSETPQAFAESLARLSSQKEMLEQQLARRSVAFRRVQDRHRLTPADLAKALPKDAVLVDLVEYGHFSPSARTKGQWDAERRLLAFIVKPGGDVHRIELESAQPVDDAVEQWRSSFGGGTAGAAAGRQLRRLVWDKLSPHLSGASTVIISPDGSLRRFPFAALPGAKDGTYLIEENVQIVMLPVPRLLPGLLEAADVSRPASLLVVGDVNYGAPAPPTSPAAPAAPAAPVSPAAPQFVTRVAPRGQRATPWPPLEATAAEMRAVAQSFRQRFGNDAAIAELRHDGATEQGFRLTAGSHRYLHLATHGYFNEEQFARATKDARQERRLGHFASEHEVVGFHPDLLSGVVLAGANQPIELNRDDGILTAAEVAALDLRAVDLAVLSACETGLGHARAGEGLLSLQRAFQVAGVRTTVTSLWKVDDLATQKLMEKFYENLWQKKMSKGEALREAQRWMLREGRQWWLDQPRGIGGTRQLDDSAALWAGFVLAGDWR